MPTRLLIALLCTLGFAAASVEDVVRQALQHNHKLLSFTYQKQAAHTRLKQARDALFPTLSFSASVGKDKYYYQYPTRKITYDSTTTFYNLSLRQPLYQAQIFARIHQEKLKEYYSALQIDAYRNDLIKNVLSLYVDGIYYATLQSYARTQLANWQKIYNQVQKRRSLRFATKSDLAMARANLTDAKNRLLQAQYNLQNIQRQLRIYTGKSVSLDATFAPNFAITLQQASLEHNPSLKLAQLNVQIAKSEVGLRKAAFYPSLNLTASYSDTDSSDSITRRGNSRLFLEVQMPLFDKRNFDAKSEAYLLYKAAKEDLADLHDRLSLQLSNLEYNIRSLLGLIQKDEALIQARSIYAQQASLSYKNALMSLADMAKALNDLYDAKTTKAAHQRELLQRFIEYQNLTGALLHNRGASLANYFIPKE